VGGGAAEEVLRLPAELARVDALLDDPVFFSPFVAFFNPRLGRPSTPMGVYRRLMFVKFRYQLGYETLSREVTDSITWRRFCRIPLDGHVPHPTTLMKLTTRCGTAAVDGCNEALLAKAAEAKLLRTSRLRADTTFVPADVVYPTDSGLLAKAMRRIATTGRRVQAAGGATRPRQSDRPPVIYSVAGGGGSAAGRVPAGGCVGSMGPGTGSAFVTTNATTTATMTSGVTDTPSAPSNRMASSVEVNGSRSIAAHIAPMPIPMAGARSIPGNPLAAMPMAAPMNIDGKTGPPRNALSDRP
jgi:IS5 family transposase